MIGGEKDKDSKLDARTPFSKFYIAQTTEERKMSSNKGSIQKVTCRDFLRMGAVAGALAILATCVPSSSGGGGWAALPDLTSGNSIPLDKLIAAEPRRKAH